MKCQYLILLLGFLFSCRGTEKSITKQWQEFPIGVGHLKPTTNTYHMFDSTGSKVGSMVFGFTYENNQLVARDTSQFDNGSIYETAEFSFDTSLFKMKSVKIDLKTRNAALDIDLEKIDQKVVGTYSIIKDSVINQIPIDTLMEFSGFRGEIYMFAHALEMEKGDTLSLKALVPTSFQVSEGQLIHEGTEQITVNHKVYTCDKIHLISDGKMPENIIWIRQKTPRKAVKFHVPGPGLDIVLVDETK